MRSVRVAASACDVDLCAGEVARSIVCEPQPATATLKVSTLPTTDTPEPTLPELIAVEIGCYRRMGTPFGDLMAETVERLQSVVSALEARTVEDFRDRREAMLLDAYRASGLVR